MDAVIFSDCIHDGLWQRSAGAYRIATELRLLGYSVQVIDAWAYLTFDGLDLLFKLIDKFVGANTVFVGFSSTFMNSWPSFHHKKPGHKVPLWYPLGLDHDSLLQLRDYIKSKNAKVDILVGGAFSGRPEPLSDIKIKGYAEKQIVEYMNWKNGKNPFFMPTVEEGKKVIANNVNADGFDFAHSEIIWAPEDCILPNESLPIEISRGCIFKCKFCAFPLNGRAKLDYLKDKDTLRQEFIRNYELYGVTDYSFSDDTFNDTTEKLEWINDISQSLPFKLSYGTYLRLDLMVAHPEQAQLLKDSGLTGAFFGIESLNTKAAQSIGKGMKTERLIQYLYHLREVWGNSVITTGGFIVGLPHDTYETMEAWLTSLLDPDFPLHSFELPSLAIQPKSALAFNSEFAEFPEKYGYSFEDNPHFWINNTYGTTRRGCNALSERFMKEAQDKGRLNFKAHLIPGLTSLGMTTEEIAVKTRSGIIEDGIYDRVYQRYLNYIGRVLNL